MNFIDQRYRSGILDVYRIRSTECGSDHYLVLVKDKQCIVVEKRKKSSQEERSEIEKLINKEVREDFQLKLQNWLQHWKV